MKTRLLSGFLAVVGGGAVFVGCFEPTEKVSAETPRVVTSPAPATAPLTQQPTATPNNTPVVAAVPPTLSPGVSEVAKLYQSNVSEDVLLAYINNYGEIFNPSADEILYLNDLGVPDNAVTAVLKHRPGGIQSVAAPAPVPVPAPALALAPQVAATAPLVPQEPVATAASVPASAQPAAQVTVNQFYDTLSPYGSWVETEYGRSWRPAVAVSNPEWRPYGDRGHWIYTDCGWYWVSDYSWGWATFHYGRWCSDRHYGWVWVPDTVWGPSWVSWRYTSDHCGWAPLPPLARYSVGVGFTYHSANVGVSFDFGLTESCYTFVPVNRFCDPHPYRYYAPRSSTTVIYNKSTVINNYIVNNNKTVINEGVGRQRIESVTKQPVQKVVIKEMPKNSLGAPDRLQKVGNETVVYKPQSPAAVKAGFSAPRPATSAAQPYSPASGNSARIVPARVETPKANVVSQPAVTSQQPRNDWGKSRAPDVKPVVPTQLQNASGPAKATTPSQAQAPLVAAPTPTRENTIPDAGKSRTVAHGDQDRFESPRSSPSTASTTPKESTASDNSALARNSDETPTSAASDRAQAMRPGIPRVSQQSSTPRAHGQGSAHGSGRQQRSEKLADKDSSSHGGGKNHD